MEVSMIKRMSRLFSTWLAGCLLSWLPSASAAIPQYVVVDVNARLYQAPDSRAAWFSQSRTPIGRVNTSGLGIRFRWISSPKPGWHEVRPVLAKDMAHCTYDSDALRPLDIQVFVRQSALHRVVTRDVRGVDNSGHTYVVHRGRWLDKGKPTIRIQGYDAELVVPKNAIGYRYAGKPSRLSRASYRYYPVQKKLVKDGEPSPNGVVQRVLKIEPLQRPGETLLTLEARCVQFQKRLKPPSRAEPQKRIKDAIRGKSALKVIGLQSAGNSGDQKGPPVLIGTLGEPAPTPPVVPRLRLHRIQRGAQIFWESGEVMGRLAADIKGVPLPNVQRKGLQCVAYNVRCYAGMDRSRCNDLKTQPHLTLCARPSFFE